MQIRDLCGAAASQPMSRAPSAATPSPEREALVEVRFASAATRLMAKAEQFDALDRMHRYLESAEQVGRGEVVTSG